MGLHITIKGLNANYMQDPTRRRRSPSQFPNNDGLFTPFDIINDRCPAGRIANVLSPNCETFFAQGKGVLQKSVKLLINH